MSTHSLESILADCQSNDVDKQVAAIWAVRNSKLYEAVPSLIPMFSSQDEDIRMLAVGAFADDLTKADPNQVGPALIPMLQDAEDLVRSDAIDALANLEYAPALEAVIYVLRFDPDWVVRATAAEAIPYLAEIDDNLALEALESALKSDPYDSVRSYAANSIGLVAMPSPDWIKKLTHYFETEESDDTKVDILGARYRLEDSSNLGDMLIGLLEDSDEQLFRVILTVLEDLLGDTNIPEKLIKDAPRLCKKILEKAPSFPIEDSHVKQVIKMLQSQIEADKKSMQ
jgi:HEAT repeat protein